MAPRAFEHKFEWDPVKAGKNFKKHGVAFDRAASVFSDPSALSRLDEGHSDNEERWATLGLDRNGIIVVVCHTYAESQPGGSSIRIISARKATKKEARSYKGA